MSEPNGTDIWVDVMIGMAKPECSMPKELARMKHEKRREYGLGTPSPSTLFDWVTPVILEQHGCPGLCAIIFLHRVSLDSRTRIPPNAWRSVDDSVPGFFLRPSPAFFWSRAARCSKNAVSSYRLKTIPGILKPRARN